MKNKLLSREDFKEKVFERDKGCCLFCEKAAVDAHHILDRKLWSDGGYYLDNGASVCEEHHIECEKTLISVEQVRSKAGIKNIVLPEVLSYDEKYDKWGNVILANGSRLKGPLFEDKGVQLILKSAGVLELFIDKIKYPRTPHLPWSLGLSSDDIKKDKASIHLWKGKRVIVTEKMDGENTTLYSDGTIHARSIDSKNHPSRNWVKNWWSEHYMDLPEGWRVCGENLYAKHSIGYDNLPSYFLGFSIWNDKNECLSWDETQEWFELLDIQSVRVIYDGTFDEEKIKALWVESLRDVMEGYVIRTADSFRYNQFLENVGKMVREKHVNTDEHWMRKEIVPNKLSNVKLKNKMGS